ncbi:MAG: DNA polymerase III subunit delta' [Desulfobacteraceae bacterium]
MAPDKADAALNQGQFPKTASAEAGLKHIVSSGKFPNALLFTGKSVPEMEKTAVELARVVNCASPGKGTFSRMACLECRSCRKITNGMHPDIIRVVPEKGVIRISKIRDLCSALTVRANEAFKRMVIFQSAETMNTEAQNALLKTLEEPPGDTVFVLLADNAESLLPTVFSRCRHIRFKMAGETEIREHLIRTHGIDPEYASICTRTANGDGRKAMLFAGITENETKTATDWAARRTWLIKQVEKLVHPAGHGAFGPMDALVTAERLDREPELLKDSLTVIRTFLRDLAVVRYTRETLVNTDFLPALQQIAGKIEPARVLSWIGKLHEAELKIESNATTRLVLEKFFLELGTHTQKA